jgi:hypothetical protein
MKIACEDRRWLVPKCVEKKQPRGFWTRFYRWLDYEDGLAAIKEWAEEFLKDDAHGPVMPGEDAPSTKRKRKMIEASRSIEEQSVIDVLDELWSLRQDVKMREEVGMKRYQPLLVLDVTIVQYVNFQLYGDEKPARGGRGLTEAMVRKLCRQLPKLDGWDDNGWEISADREWWAFYDSKGTLLERRRGHLLSTRVSEEPSAQAAMKNDWKVLSFAQIKKIIKRLPPAIGTPQD